MLFSPRMVVRHLAGFVLLAFAWHELQAWYWSHFIASYLWFGALFVAAILIVAGPEIYRAVKEAPTAERAMCFVLLLLTLPYGEWLEINFHTSHEDWSRQLIIQCAFIMTVLFSFRGLTNESVHRFVSDAFQRLSKRRMLIFLFPVLFFLLTVYISLVVFRQTPLVQDSAAHLFQARIFAAGYLTAPAPPQSQFFDYLGDMLVIANGRWFSMYAPGFAFLLAIPVGLHLEWFLCPLLGAITVLIWILYARRWYGEKTALLFAVLLWLSPFLFVMSGTIMVYTPELLIASSLMYLLRWELDESSNWRTPLCAILLCFGMSIRGFSLVCFLVPVLFFFCWKQLKNREPVKILMIFIGVTTGMFAMALYQKATTGSPFVSGYQLEYPQIHLGFGRSYFGEAHTPLRGLEHTSNNVLGINSYLTGWYSGSIIFLLLWLVSRRHNRWDLIHGACIGILVTFYFFYSAQDLVLGPRQYYITAPLLLLFIVQSTGIDNSQSSSKQRFALLLLFASVLTFIPFRLAEFIHKYQPVNTAAGNLRTTMTGTTQKTIVFVEEESEQNLINWNDPFFRAPVIIARDRNSQNQELLKSFPGYTPKFFRIDDTSANGVSGYRLFNKPSIHKKGEVSFYQLGLALVGQANDDDCFELSYSEIFSETDPEAAADFLENQTRLVPPKDKPYRKNFKAGLIHLARMIIQVNLAYDRSKENWKRALDCDTIRAQYKAALENFQQCGEIGTSAVVALRKVSDRIDRNRDDYFSDSELQTFLAPKVHLLSILRPK